MHRKPPYTPTRFGIIFDGEPPVPSLYIPKEGQYIVHETGSAFFVTGVRQSPNNPLKFNCKVLRWPADEIPPDGKVHRTKAIKKPRRTLRNRPKLLSTT